MIDNCLRAYFCLNLGQDGGIMFYRKAKQDNWRSSMNEGPSNNFVTDELLFLSLDYLKLHFSSIFSCLLCFTLIAFQISKIFKTEIYAIIYTDHIIWYGRKYYRKCRTKLYIDILWTMNCAIYSDLKSIYVRTVLSRV